MRKNAKIYIAGHRGLVGSAILRGLQKTGYSHLVTRTSKELDLRRQSDVEAFFDRERPEYVFLAAAKVGGIHANSTFTAEFIYDNLLIASNVINSSHQSGVKKLLNLGSSCIYPKLAPQPMKEEYLMTGPLKPTNEPYAIAKIAAIKLCRYYHDQYNANFISLMPTNLYGPGDNFDLQNSHVLPALLRKFHDAKAKKATSVTIWGTGEPYREFLYVDDLAEACILIMERYDWDDIGEFINVGAGKDLRIIDLALMIKDIVGFQGDITMDAQKPDGMHKKILDVSKIHSLGWEPKVTLKAGIQKTYEWYLSHLPDR